MYTPTRCIQQLSTLRRTLPTRQAFVSPKCCGTLQCAHHFSRMRGRVHFGEFGPGILSGPNLQSAPRFCKVRRQSVRVRGGFLQSAHFAEMRGAGLVKSRVFPKTPAQFLIAHACHLREMRSVAFFRKRACRFWEKGRCRCRNSEEADFRENACIEILKMDEVGFFL